MSHRHVKFRILSSIGDIPQSSPFRDGFDRFVTCFRLGHERSLPLSSAIS
jgi:hypothetical protein